MRQVDEVSLPYVGWVIRQYGWPGWRAVGVDGAHAAWLLVQHLPHDYQRRWLPLLRTAVYEHDAAARDLAYLADRVDVGRRFTQVYGTQRLLVGENWRLYPLTVPDRVNEFRGGANLGPLPDEMIIHACTWIEVDHVLEHAHG